MKDELKVVGYSREEITAEDVAIVRYVVAIVAIRGAILAATRKMPSLRFMAN